MQSIKEHNLKANHNSVSGVVSAGTSIKEHNLKANHNDVSPVQRQNLSVCNLSKNTI